MINRQTKRAIIASLISAGVLGLGSGLVLNKPALIVEKPSLYISKAPAIIHSAGFWDAHEKKFLSMPITLGMLAKSSVAHSSISYIGTTTDATNLGTYTFTSAAIGTAAANRTIIVVISGQGISAAPTVTSISIGGSNMTQAAIMTEAVNGALVDIHYLAFPTGTTATFVVTLNVSNSHYMTISVYAAYLNAGTLVDTATNAQTGTTNCLLTDLAIDADGVAVAGITCDAVGITNTLTWGGTDTFTKNFDATTDVGSSARWSAATNQTSTTADADIAESGSSRRVSAGASFK